MNLIKKCKRGKTVIFDGRVDNLVSEKNFWFSIEIRIFEAGTFISVFRYFSLMLTPAKVWSFTSKYKLIVNSITLEGHTITNPENIKPDRPGCYWKKKNAVINSAVNEVEWRIKSVYWCFKGKSRFPCCTTWVRTSQGLLSSSLIFLSLIYLLNPHREPFLKSYSD